MLSARPIAFTSETYNAKTPARTVQDRNLLQENLHRVPHTVNAKGKALHTPRRTLTVQSHKVLSHSVKPTIRVQKPLGDKTPFPNRVANAVPFDTPAPQTAKLAKLSLLEAPHQTLPEPLLRPSSARKSLRAPRASGGAQQFAFKTPVTLGNHWDVSDGEIEVDADECVEETADVRGEDDDEIEYMPPTAIVPAYEPPFDMPNYTRLGANIRELAHSYKFDDTDDLNHALDADLNIGSQELWKSSGFTSVESRSPWEAPELSPLEDELLIHEKSSVPKTKPPQGRTPAVAQHKHTSSLPIIKSTTRSIPATKAKVPIDPPRPASRAPSKSISTATTTVTSSRSVAGSTGTASATKPSTTSRSTTLRLRSQTTSQIARPSSAAAAHHEANTRKPSGVSSKDVTSRSDAVVARPKTTTSVYATTTGPSRAKQVPTRVTPAITTSTAAPSRSVMRAGPSSTHTSANAARATGSATTAKASSKQRHTPVNSALGKRPVPIAVLAATAQGAGDILTFDDAQAGDEDFVFEI